MAKLENGGAGRISRREALALGAGAGVGLVSMLHADMAGAQQGAAGAGRIRRPPADDPPPDPKFPQPPTWATELRQLAPNFYAYIQGNGPPASGGGISNACVMVGGDDLMVFDTLNGPGAARPFIAAIRNTIGNQPFGRVVYTHNHGDHVNGGQYFMPAEIVAHPFCRERVLQMAAAMTPDGPPDPAYGRIRPTWEGNERKELFAPSVTVTDKMTYYYQGTVVELIHPGVAHTWGDLLVYLPEHKVLFVGDVAMFHVAPFAHNGHVTPWLEVMDRILDMDVETIIPGHGPIGGKKEMGENAEYFRLLKGEARKRFDGGMSAGKAAADINMGKFTNWMGAGRIVLNTFRLYAEFNGTLTPITDNEALRVATDEYNAIVRARA